MPAERTTRGKGLTRERLVQAALDIVDRDGLSALSMRRLGAELGVDPMAAYRHFPNKDALLDGVMEAMVAEVDLDIDADAEWQSRLRRLARANLEAMMAHPNALPLLATRPLTTPGSLRIVEKALEITRSAGVPLLDGVLAIDVTGLFTAGFTAAVAASARDPRTPEDLRAGVSSLPHEQFPYMIEALETGQLIESHSQLFEFFLDALVTHLETLAD